jgi:threonine dehydratase
VNVSTLPLQFADIGAAAQRLRGVAVTTPTLRDAELDARAGNAVHIKCENLQRIGAFKFRGAYNRLSLLSADERQRGVVAFSSGNHAAGVAMAARLLGVPATIVMPADAPTTKMDTTRGLGASIVTYDRLTQDREAIARRIAGETGATIVPPFDDYAIMAGQGTVALELLSQVADLDALLVPLGGGGLLSGCATVVRTLRPQMHIFGVEPQAGNDWQLSLAKGERVRIAIPDTIADGLQSPAPGELTWPIVRALADGVVTVSDDEICAAMRLAFERLRLIVEPSGAAALAAAVSQKIPLHGVRVGVIVSGGNVDPQRFCNLLERAS